MYPEYRLQTIETMDFMKDLFNQQRNHMMEEINKLKKQSTDNRHPT
jgi:hypothetical protein